jgi:hypothetical protein
MKNSSSQIAYLNQRLGDALGRVRGGSLPRFCWIWAPDVPYWARQLGKVWVLCQWRKPSITEKQWQHAFQGRYPYPANGMHHAHPETALPEGEAPTLERTQFYIRALDEQMTTSLTQQLCDVNNEMVEHKQQDDQEWSDFVDDTLPAYANYEPGRRGGHVSYGGTS